MALLICVFTGKNLFVSCGRWFKSPLHLKLFVYVLRLITSSSMQELESLKKGSHVRKDLSAPKHVPVPSTFPNIIRDVEYICVRCLHSLVF